MIEWQALDTALSAEMEKIMIRSALAVICGSVVACAAAMAADLSAADKIAIFKAAGFKAQGSSFTRCPDDTSSSKMPGAIELQDLNGDGTSEVFVTESSTFCYGNTEQAFVLMARDAKTGWRKLLDEVGVAVPKDTRHKGWKDIEVGGPGMGPFPVYQFNGKVYAIKK